MLIDEAGYNFVVNACTMALKEIPTTVELRAALALINRASQVGFLFSGDAENLVEQKHAVEACLAARRKFDRVES